MWRKKPWHLVISRQSLKCKKGSIECVMKRTTPNLSGCSGAIHSVSIRIESSTKPQASAGRKVDRNLSQKSRRFYKHTQCLVYPITDIPEFLSQMNRRRIFTTGGPMQINASLKAVHKQSRRDNRRKSHVVKVRMCFNPNVNHPSLKTWACEYP